MWERDFMCLCICYHHSRAEYVNIALETELFVIGIPLHWTAFFSELYLCVFASGEPFDMLGLFAWTAMILVDFHFAPLQLWVYIGSVYMPFAKKIVKFGLHPSKINKFYERKFAVHF